MSVLDLFDLTGKRALVTGGSKGLGKAFALALAEAGADVAVTSRHLDEVEVTAGEIRELGRQSLAIEAEIRDEHQVRNMVAQAETGLGPIDVLVNNAGYGRVNKTMDEVTLDEWSLAIDTNITGTFLCAREMAKRMIGRKCGKMINLSSMCGHTIVRGIPPGSYDVSKLGIVAMTRGMAVQWAPHGITVNSIAPGSFVTDANREWFQRMPELRDEIANATPLGRVGQPEELGGLIVYLASEASNFMTGETIIIDGGYTIWN